MLSEKLTRGHASAVELRHIFEGENLFAIHVILEPELKEERDEKANEARNKRPWKRLTCCGSDH